jgi:hypothetical protein
MLSFAVFAKLQTGLHLLPALLRPAPLRAPFIQPLCIQSLTHSFAQRTAHSCFLFNRFRILSITTGGVGGLLLFSTFGRLDLRTFQRVFDLFPFFSHSLAPSRDKGSARLPGPEKSSPLFSNSSELFCAFLHFFALTQNSTRFFSIDSALFRKNTGGGGGGSSTFQRFNVQTSLPKMGQCRLRHMVRDVYCSGRRVRTV